MIWALLLVPLLIVALGALGQYLAWRDHESDHCTDCARKSGAKGGGR